MPKPSLNEKLSRALIDVEGIDSKPVRSTKKAGGKVKKTDENSTTLYLYPTDQEKLLRLAQSLFVDNLEQNTALAFRTCLHLFDSTDSKKLELLDEPETKSGIRVQVYIYDRDKDTLKECGVKLIRAGFSRVNKSLIARLVIRAAPEPGELFTKTANDLRTRYDQRKQK